MKTRILAWATAFASTAMPFSHAATTIDWSASAGNSTWTAGANWDGGTAPLNTLSGNIARFNQTGYTSQPNYGTANIAGLTFGDGATATAPITLNGTALSLGGAIIVHPNAGPVTISGTNQVGWGDYSCTNNSTNSLTIEAGLKSRSSSANSTFTFTGTGDISVSGTISNGTGTNKVLLTKSGSGNLILSGANTFTGATKINTGTLKLANELALQNSPFTVTGTGTLDLGAVGSPTFGGLTGGGNFTLPGHLSGLTLNPGANATYTYNGTLSGPAGLQLNKAGAGTQELTGTWTHSGNTTIVAGSLLLTGGGSLVGGSTVLVSAGTFGGNGTSSGAVSVLDGATLQAGSGAAASLGLAGDLNMAAGSVLSLGLGSDANAHGTLARTGSGTWQFAPQQTFRFLDLGAAAGITYSGILTGLAPGLDVSGWNIANAGWSGAFTFDGSAVSFELLAIPEPLPLLTVALGFTLALTRAALRRRGAGGGYSAWVSR